MWKTDYLNTRFPLPTLQYAGHSEVKLKKRKLSLILTFQAFNSFIKTVVIILKAQRLSTFYDALIKTAVILHTFYHNYGN